MTSTGTPSGPMDAETLMNPKVSVIVCTRNRAHSIIGCLESIAQALSNIKPEAAEVIVVDNASEDDTFHVVQEWMELSNTSGKLLVEPKKGLASSRNCGLQAARGEVLIFTDDDCRLADDHVSAALRHDANDIGLVIRGGRVELGDPTDLPITIKTQSTGARWSRELKSAKRENLGSSILGCNMVMRRAVVDHLGLFDQRFGAGSDLRAGEEIDYIFRGYLLDVLIEYVPDMVVYHHHGRKLPSAGRKLLINYMIGTGALYAKYIFRNPDFCRPAYWDLKVALRECVSGQNKFRPDLKFSYKHAALYSLCGAIRYLITSLKGSNWRKA
jgi:glycosyltransferase involved in cell wall biosynthesis